MIFSPSLPESHHLSSRILRGWRFRSDRRARRRAWPCSQAYRLDTSQKERALALVADAYRTMEWRLRCSVAIRRSIMISSTCSRNCMSHDGPKPPPFSSCARSGEASVRWRFRGRSSENLESSRLASLPISCGTPVRDTGSCVHPRAAVEMPSRWTMTNCLPAHVRDGTVQKSYPEGTVHEELRSGVIH